MEAAPTDVAVPPEGDSLGPSSIDESLFTEPQDVMSPGYWDRLEAGIPGRLKEDNPQTFQQIKALTRFETRKADIEAAAQELEPYRKKFERLTRNTGKFLKRAEKLFADAPFEAMRFRADDLQKAFEAVGYPPVGAADELHFEHMRKAIAFLVDRDRREFLSIQLMQQLPDFVDAGRHIDAWILQHSAFLMTEDDSKIPGPFLICMFTHGMSEWEDQRDREQNDMFRQLGVDPDEIRRRGVAGVDSLVQELMAKQGASEELERFLNDHPDLKALSEAQCRESEDAAKPCVAVTSGARAKRMAFLWRSSHPRRQPRTTS